jgi:hypothetical protein
MLDCNKTHLFMLVLGKRKAVEVNAPGGISTSSSAPISIPSDEPKPSGTGTTATGTGSGRTGTNIGTYTPQQRNLEVLAIDGVDVQDSADRKRTKKLTSDVWQYFTKKEKVLEVGGKKYIQMWGHCNFPNCRAKYRAESNYGTTSFQNHLKSTHNIVKGQLQLKTEKDHGKDITVIEPYKYDQEVSLKKLYLAIVMHEYPFNMVEHDYFVEFIKSLRLSFTLMSRVTVRKDTMDIFLEQKEKLYLYLKIVRCRFSTTMDMWTSCQNKSYMCVTINWVDEEWCMQKRIIGFFHVEGRHIGQKLSQTFSKVMVK